MDNREWGLGNAARPGQTMQAGRPNKELLQELENRGVNRLDIDSEWRES